MEQKMESDKPLTPKQQYDAEMAGINKATAEAKGEDLEDKKEMEAVAEDAEEILDDLESKEDSKALDKSMGAEKKPVGPGPFSKAVNAGKATAPPKAHTMTSEQFHKMKEARNAQAALQSLRDITASKLPQADQKILIELLEKHEGGLTKDVVLQELLDEKKETAKLVVKAMASISDLQKKLLNDVATASNNLVKARGAMEGIDHMLLKRYKKLDAADKAPEKKNMN